MFDQAESNVSLSGDGFKARSAEVCNSLVRAMGNFDWSASGEFNIGPGLMAICYMPREDMLVA